MSKRIVNEQPERDAQDSFIEEHGREPDAQELHDWMNRNAPSSGSRQRLEMARQSLARLQAQGVPPSNPMCQGLAMQVARHERDAWRKANGGWWGENSRFLQMPCTPGRGGSK